MLERIEQLLTAILEQLVILNGKKPATRSKAEKEPENPPAPPSSAPVAELIPTPTAAPASAAPKISREQLGGALVALAKVDMEKAKAVLAQFKATKLAEVAESDYAAVAAAIEKASQPVSGGDLL